MSHAQETHAPELIGSIRFEVPPSAGGAARAELPTLPEGEILVEVLFHAPDYRFSNHCCYARLNAGAPRRTFAHMTFAPHPPGVRVGPWPGWRGIAPMPPAVLRRGNSKVDLHFQFYGDEERSGHVRAVCSLPDGPDRSISVDSGDRRLIPDRGTVYRTTRRLPVRRRVELRQDLVDAHPRLLITQAELPALRTRRSRSHAWGEILRLLDSWDLPPALTAESKTVAGPERLRGEDKVLLAAIVALVDPNADSIGRARDAYRRYMDETARPDYEPLGIDTQAGETLFVLAVGYDWLFEHLALEDRERARHWLFTVADRCWSFIGGERRDYAQAHYLGCALGLLTFAFLFWDEHPRAKEWSEHFAGVLDVVASMLPEDGFYPHGINLWIYEYGFLLRWLELFRICADRDLWTGTDHWRHASAFRASVTSPDGMMALTFGDPQYRVGGDAWMHFLIGERTGDRNATDLGHRLAALSHEGVDFRATPPRRRVYEFLYCGGTTDDRAPECPPLALFPDGAQLSVRTPDLLFCFRGGPPLGQRRYQAGEFGAYGHGDPAHGAFLLLFRGCLMVCGPGPVYRRQTAHHSCPTADGLGQLGDTCVWLPDFYPPSALPAPAEWLVRGDRAALRARMHEAYLPAAGIRHAERQMFVDPERCIVGADHIICDRERGIAWHLSSRYPIVMLPDRQVFRLGPAEGPVVELTVLEPRELSWQVEPAEIVPGYTNDGEPLHTLTIRSDTGEQEFVWCLSLDGRPASDYRFTETPAWQVKSADGWTIQQHGQWIYPEDFDAHQT